MEKFANEISAQIIIAIDAGLSPDIIPANVLEVLNRSIAPKTAKSRI